MCSIVLLYVVVKVLKTHLLLLFVCICLGQPFVYDPMQPPPHPPSDRSLITAIVAHIANNALASVVPADIAVSGSIHWAFLLTCMFYLVMISFALGEATGHVTERSGSGGGARSAQQPRSRGSQKRDWLME